jgi:hypothetical protein
LPKAGAAAVPCFCFFAVALVFWLSSFAAGGGSAFAVALSLLLPLSFLPLPFRRERRALESVKERNKTFSANGGTIPAFERAPWIECREPQGLKPAHKFRFSHQPFSPAKSNQKTGLQAPGLSISIRFPYCHLQLFLSKTAQKSDVKTQNHLNVTNKRRSSWHFSYSQPAILKIVERKQVAPANRPGLTRLDGIFWTQLICYEYFAAVYGA